MTFSELSKMQMSLSTQSETNILPVCHQVFFNQTFYSSGANPTRLRPTVST